MWMALASPLYFTRSATGTRPQVDLLSKLIGISLRPLIYLFVLNYFERSSK